MGIADGELTSIALCWTAERGDGAGVALTSHDQAIFRGGIRHEPSPGIIPAAVSRSSGTKAEAAEVAGALNGEGLTDQDLVLGRWDGARVELTAIDWEEAEREGIRLLRGRLGEVCLAGGEFVADLKGAASFLTRAVCSITSPECRAELGDKACRADLSDRTRRARVIASDGHRLTLNQQVDDRFLFGRMRYNSGENCGSTTTVLSVEGNVVRVRDHPRAIVDTGCIVELREGCDKTLQTCAQRFANAVNFRGEPHLPGNDLLTRYPGN